ncbi:MAG: J domain-containing protein [Proteobacteria bacterium]|nr:J domain-containing protein [Pseudomonadota bacterium]
MAARRDLYAVLGVARGADADAIRTSYRALARKFHPDLNQGRSESEERFKEVSEAYAVPSDPEKRALYDEFGAVSLDAGFNAEAARGSRRFGGGFGQPGGDGYGFDINDVLGSVFGGRARRSGVSFRGEDLEVTLELEFLEAARGATRQINVMRPGPDGRPASERVTVRIPPGVDDGGRIRIPGKGAESRGGGPAGDLFAKIRIRPSATFRRDGRDLLLDLPVTVSEATLGARIEIPTLDGSATVTIPPGSDSGRRLRLRGKGIADPKSGTRGELYVTVQICVPVGLDPDARAKLQELSAFDPPGIRKEWESAKESES